MKNILTAVSCAAALTLSSCVSMDITPKSQGNSESWYSTELELEMAANRMYTIGYWDSPAQDPETWSDNFTYRLINWHRDSGAPLNGNLDGNDYITYHIWQQDYKLIAQANLILTHSGRAKANGVAESVVNQYRAEAYFARACKYAELMAYFGDVPYVDKPLTISEAEAMERMSIEELKPKVYSDFDHAIDSLPATYAETQRFTKGAALAMKARFALYMGDWEEVVDATEKCMALGIYSLNPDFGAVFLQNTKQIPEKIFVIPRSAANNVVVATWFVQNGLPRNSGGYGSDTPSWDLFASYLCTDGLPIDESPLFDPNNPFENRDPRLSATIVPFGALHCGWYFEPDNKTATSSTGATKSNQDCRLNQEYTSYNGLLWKKGIDATWQNESGGMNSKVENDLIIMRYADVLLMNAEAKIQLGQASQEVFDETINAVRARAYGVTASDKGMYPAVTYSGDKTTDMRALQIERRMETAKESLRYLDVIRWGLYDKAFNGFNYLLPVNDDLEKHITSNNTDNPDSDGWFWGGIVPDIDEDGIADFSKLEAAGYARKGAQRIFPDHQVLFPIPTYDRTLMPNLSQNEGY